MFDINLAIVHYLLKMLMHELLIGKNNGIYASELTLTSFPIDIDFREPLHHIVNYSLVRFWWPLVQYYTEYILAREYYVILYFFGLTKNEVYHVSKVFNPMFTLH